jgi:SNF2 family DNA or RNA helicase
MKSFSLSLPKKGLISPLHKELVSLFGVQYRLQYQDYIIPIFHLETVYKAVFKYYPALASTLLKSPRYKDVREHYRELKANALNFDSIASNFDFPCSNDMTPLPYQKSGVEEILTRYKQGFRGCMLSDVAGLGKTFQAIGVYSFFSMFNKDKLDCQFTNKFSYNKTNDKNGLVKYFEKNPKKHLTRAIVVTPNSLLKNWQQEFYKGTRANPQVNILTANSKPSDLDGAEILICNFNNLAKQKKNILQFGPDLVIVDEAHNISNNNSKRARTLKDICHNSKFTLLLTGTAIKNYIRDLRFLLYLIDPDFVWQDKVLYEDVFCNRVKTEYGYDSTGFSNQRLLRRILRMHYYIRRKKGQVLEQLPKKTVEYISVNI